MKKFLFLFVCATAFAMPAYADIMTQQATQELVKRKQDVLNPDSIQTSGSGAVVSDISADNGVVTVQRAEVQIPVGGKTSDSHAALWVQ